MTLYDVYLCRKIGKKSRWRRNESVRRFTNLCLIFILGDPTEVWLLWTMIGYVNRVVRFVDLEIRLKIKQECNKCCKIFHTNVEENSGNSLFF